MQEPKVLLILLCCFHLCTFDKAFSQETVQKPYYTPPVAHITSDDGLASDETYSSIRDSYGYLWVGTDNGVSRLNGYEIENFTTNDGLIDNTIFQIRVDYQDRVWFAGYNNNLCYWDWKSEKFTPYEFNEILDKQTQKNFSITDFAFDKNGRLFVGFTANGYVIINQDGTIHEKSLGPLNPDKDVHWVVGRKRFDGKLLSYGQQVLFHQLDSTQISSSNYLLLNIEGFTSFKFPTTNRVAFKSKYGYDLNRIKNFYTSLIFNDQWQFFIQPEISYTPKIPEDLFVEDKSIYIQSDKKYFLLHNEELFLLDSNLNKLNKVLSIKNHELSSIYSNDEEAYINSLNKGIYIVNLSGIITNKEIPDLNPVGMCLEKNSILIFQDKSLEGYAEIVNDSLISHTTVPVLNFKNVNFNSIVHFRDSTSKNSKSILSSTQSNQVKYLLRNTSQVEISYDHNPSIKVLELNQRVFCSLNFHDKVLYGGIDDLYVLEHDSALVPFEIPGISLKNTRIQGLQVFDDTLYIATKGNGLIIASDTLLYHINQKNGLSSNLINQILIYDGIIWVATNQGIDGIELKEKPLLTYHLDKENGCMRDNVKYMLIKDDHLFLAIKNGISKIDLSKLKGVNKENIKIRISEVTINDTLQLNPNDENISLSYNQNNIKFKYIGIPTHIGQSIEYRYMLEGLENQFTYTNSREIKYNSLNPGNYNLKLQAKTKNSPWPKEFVSTNFTINQIYWRTIWFKALVTLLSLGILISVFVLVLLNEKKKNRLTQELNEIEQLALNAQMNPHFIFNALNSIQNYVLTNDKVLANKYLVKFSRLVRLVFENSKKQYITLEEELKACKLYLELESIRIENKLNFNLDIEPSLNSKTILIPCLLIQPILENAIWHGIVPLQTNGTITLRVFPILNMEKLCIEVEDNGVGQNHHSTKSTKNKSSSGIVLTQKRVKIFSETFNSFGSFEIEDLEMRNYNTTGTLVRIIIPLHKK